MDLLFIAEFEANLNLNNLSGIMLFFWYQKILFLIKNNLYYLPQTKNLGYK